MLGSCPVVETIMEACVAMTPAEVLKQMQIDEDAQALRKVIYTGHLDQADRAALARLVAWAKKGVERREV